MVTPSGADNRRVPPEVIPKVVPKATAPFVIKFPLPVLIDELLVVIPPTEDRRSGPVEVMPNVLPRVRVEPTVRPSYPTFPTIVST